MFTRGYRSARGRFLLSAAFVLPGLAFYTASAAAQTSSDNGADNGTTVETVVVTAEKRSENLQNVGMSVSAFSGDQLESANITSMWDLMHFVPGLNITQANNNRNTAISIRTTGSSGTNPGIDPDVGIYLDGVYMPDLGPVYNELADIQTVEVLRGPQGTLYGRNTATGAINITSRAPTQDTEAMVDFEYGNYDETRVTGYVGGGITDDIAGRLSVWTDEHSGYEKNLYNDTPVNDSDQYGGRGRVRWTPDADTTVDLIGFYSHIFTHGTDPTQVNPLGLGEIVAGYTGCSPCTLANSPFVTAQKALNPNHPYVVPGPFEVNEEDPPAESTDTWGGSLTVSRVLPFGPTLTNILAFNKYVDNIPSLANTAIPEDVAFNPQYLDTGTTSDELRIVSPGKQLIDYVAGLYLFSENLNYYNTAVADVDATRNFGANGTVALDDTSNYYYGQTTNAAAVYGQATVNVTDRFRAIGGIRYSYDHKDATMFDFTYNPRTGGAASKAFTTSVFVPLTVAQFAAAGPTSRTDRPTTWTGGLQYDVMEGVMAYFTAGSGYKDGGFNARSATGGPYTFAPETVLTYELGAKSLWFDDKVLLNADVYRMLPHGIQASTLNPATGIGQVVSNSGNTRVQGVEVDAQARPIDYLSLLGSMAYTDAVYTYYPKGTCITNYPYAGLTPPPGAPPESTAGSTAACNYTGFRPSGAPKWQYSLNARWEQPWRDTSYQWFVAGDVTFRGSTYMDASLDPRSYQSGYALFDASFGVEPVAGNWRVQLWGKNLGNKAYWIAESAEAGAALISAGGTAAANGFEGYYGQPRTFGIEGSYKF